MRQQCCRDFATHRRNRLGERCSARYWKHPRGLDPNPIAVRDFNKYTISALPIKARCGKCGAACGSVRAANVRCGVRHGSRATQSRLPLLPQQQTFLSPVVTSERCCQKQTLFLALRGMRSGYLARRCPFDSPSGSVNLHAFIIRVLNLPLIRSSCAALDQVARAT
jgi:hypothetical protein